MDESLKIKKALIMLSDAERLVRLLDLKSDKAISHLEDANVCLRRTIDDLEKAYSHEVHIRS